MEMIFRSKLHLLDGVDELQVDLYSSSVPPKKVDNYQDS